MRKLSVIVPAHNEEKTIGDFVEALSSILEKLLGKRVLQDYEIIVLDDGSTDKTGTILKSIENSKLRIISNNYASGIHKAFERLYSEACMEWVLLVPGDAQWPVSEVEKLIIFHFGPSMTIPTVTRRRIKSGYSPIRIVVSSGFSLFAKYFLKSLSQPDPGSIKVLPREVVNLGYISNSVLVEIEKMLCCEVMYGELRQFEIDIVPRVYGSSSAITLKTLKPILIDCCKMVISYKILGERLTNEESGR